MGCENEKKPLNGFLGVGHDGARLKKHLLAGWICWMLAARTARVVGELCVCVLDGKKPEAASA